MWVSKAGSSPFLGSHPILFKEVFHSQVTPNTFKDDSVGLTTNIDNSVYPGRVRPSLWPTTSGGIPKSPQGRWPIPQNAWPSRSSRRQLVVWRLRQQPGRRTCGNGSHHLRRGLVLSHCRHGDAARASETGSWGSNTRGAPRAYPASYAGLRWGSIRDTEGGSTRSEAL